MNDKPSSTVTTKKKQLTLWQWIRENDIVILILAGLVTVTCTRMASHVDEHYVQPHVNRLLNITPDVKPSPHKMLLQFALILLGVYVVVEYIIKPQAPLSSYLLPDAVSRVKEEEGAIVDVRSSGSASKNTNIKAQWDRSFFKPPLSREHLELEDFPF